MAAGLFELRKDAITGWWVAVVVDREFQRWRFERPAEAVGEPPSGCANCRGDEDADEPGDARARPGEGVGVRVRTLKPHAFTVAGTEREAHGGSTDDRPPSLGLAGERGSWMTIIAPPGHHGALVDEAAPIVLEMLTRAREQVRAAAAARATEYLQVVQNWGRQAGAMTNHLCLDVYDLPQIPHRIGEELGGAARYLIREGVCPFCRLVQDELARRERLVYEDAASVCFAPYASRSPFELWVVPRHHEADFGRATDVQLASAAETLRSVLRRLDVLERPAYNLVLHTAPLRERVDETYHWHWELHPRLRDVGGLELGTGLPVNPISPEEAVEVLLAATTDASDATPPEPVTAAPTGRFATAPRSWDSFPRDGSR